MGASYPATLKTFTTKTDKVDLVAAAHINDLQDETLAIQTELGTDIAGSCTDLKTRLAVGMADSGGIQNGASFPGSPVAMQHFFRSDLNVNYVRNAANTAWITQLTDASLPIKVLMADENDTSGAWVDIDDNGPAASFAITLTAPTSVFIAGTVGMSSNHATDINVQLLYDAVTICQYTGGSNTRTAYPNYEWFGAGDTDANASIGAHITSLAAGTYTFKAQMKSVGGVNGQAKVALAFIFIPD